MACNCLAELDRKVKDHYGPDAYLETVTAINTRTFEPLGERCKPLTIRFPHTKRDGTQTERFLKASIASVYCPFCGTCYQDNATPEKTNHE